MHSYRLTLYIGANDEHTQIQAHRLYLYGNLKVSPAELFVSLSTWLGARDHNQTNSDLYLRALDQENNHHCFVEFRFHGVFDLFSSSGFPLPSSF